MFLFAFVPFRVRSPLFFISSLSLSLARGSRLPMDLELFTIFCSPIFELFRPCALFFSRSLGSPLCICFFFLLHYSPPMVLIYSLSTPLCCLLTPTYVHHHTPSRSPFPLLMILSDGPLASSRL